MKEEKFPHTRKPPLAGKGVGGPLEPQRRAQQQGCGQKSGKNPAQRIGADQHSAA